MKVALILAWAALPLVMLAACVPAKNSGSAELQRQVDALRQEMTLLKDQTRLAELRASDNAEAQAEIRRLRQQLDKLSANVESSPQSADGEAMKTQLQALDARLDRLETSTASAAPLPAAPLPAAPTPLASEPLNPPLPADPFSEGKRLFEQKMYPAAMERLRTYLAAEPQGEQADAAQFYIAESLYAQQNYEEAILEYQKLIKGFAQSSQVASSLLKQGFCFQALGDKDGARLLYTKVTRDFPKSYAASVAQQRLKDLH